MLHSLKDLEYQEYILFKHQYVEIMIDTLQSKIFNKWVLHLEKESIFILNPVETIVKKLK